jgi:hypothetical protein
MKEGEIELKKALINAFSMGMVCFYTTPVADLLLAAAHPKIILTQPAPLWQGILENLTIIS